MNCKHENDNGMCDIVGLSNSFCDDFGYCEGFHECPNYKTNNKTSDTLDNFDDIEYEEYEPDEEDLSFLDQMYKGEL